MTEWSTDGVTVEDVDPEEARANLDRLARTFLRVSGDEFLQMRARGETDPLRDEPGFSAVNAVASLLDHEQIPDLETPA